jgi:hypothetical protein
VSGDAVHQPTWPLLLKIEHMVKLQVFGNNSKTVINIKNLTWGKKLSDGITGHNFETRNPSEDSDQFWFPLV